MSGPAPAEPVQPVRVYVEQGTTWSFAAALDWPGWCRRGRSEPAALEALLDAADRYRQVAGPAFTAGPLVVVGRVPGSSTTDFGAPGTPGPGDDAPLDAPEAARQVALLRACWDAFDRAVAAAPEQLPKGPRGGGRDRDAIAAHVRDAERSYSARAGRRVPPRTPWPEQRDQLAAALLEAPGNAAWPGRYALRRCAWHVLDHAWELQDKSG